MKNLKVQSYLYDKVYNENYDIVEYSLTIKNSLWNILIKITSNISVENLKSGTTDLVITSHGITQYALTYNSLTTAFFEAEQFLQYNNLLIYVQGYGLQDYFVDDKFSSTPKFHYNDKTESGNNQYYDR